MQDTADISDASRGQKKSAFNIRAAVLAVVCFCLIGGTSLLLSQKIKQENERALRANAELLAMNLADRIGETINANLHALENFADNWRGQAPEDERQYIAQAASLQSRFEALQAVNWITPNYIIKYVAPIKGNVSAMGVDLKRHPVAGPVLDMAFDQRRTQITPTLELLQGGRGFAAYVPVINSEGDIVGLVNGVFRIRTMLASILGGDYLANYTIRVRENASVLFEMQGNGSDPNLTRTSRVNAADHKWDIDVTAAPVTAGIDATAPQMISITGLIMAALFSGLLYFYASRRESPISRKFQHIRGRENVSDLALTINRSDGHLLAMSPETANFFDLREEDFGFIRLYNLAPEFQSDGTSSQRAQDKLLSAMTQGETEVRREWVVRSAEGVHLVCDLLMTPSTSNSDHMDVLLHHNPAANAAVNRLRYLATHDPLTGLPNRALFDDRLNQAVAHAKRYGKLLSVLMVDIDNFRAVNDRYGADVGDETLRSISGRLRATVREKDTCSRLSGDTFAIIATDLSEAEGAALVAERIVEAISHPIPIGGDEIRLHVSVGVALYPNDARAPSQLLANADAAMYRAQKSAESSYCFFVETMNNVMHARLSLEAQLRRAVDEKRFVLEYQPRFRLSDHTLTGFEALLRWHDDSGLRHLPSDFIAVADRTGLLAPLGRWIITSVCQQIRQWRTDGYQPVPVALNLSGRQFIQADIIKNIHEETERYEIHPALIEIEVAEDVAMRDPEHSLAQFYRFAEAGISLTLDQFGATHSSLRYLKRFPVQRIKLSQSLFDIELDEQPENSVLGPATRLCKSLNRRVVAVGVETEEQLAMLGAAECDEIQGFIFSPPVASIATTSFMKRHIAPEPPADAPKGE